MPATLADVLYLDVDPENVEPAVEKLVTDVRRHAAEGEASAPTPSDTATDPASPPVTAVQDATPKEEPETIRITEIVRDGIGEPAIREQRDAEARAAQKQAHEQSIERIADRLKFD